MNINIEGIKTIIRRVTVKGSFTSNVSSTLFTQILGLLISIGNLAIIARWLGKEGIGILAVSQLVPRTFISFLSGGIGLSNIYYTGKEKYGIDELSANSMAYALIVTIIGSIIFSILVVTGAMEVLVPKTPIKLLLIGMILFPIELCSSLLQSILMGKQLIVTINIFQLVRTISIFVSVIVLVVILKVGITGAILAYIVAGMLYLLTVVVKVKKLGGTILPKCRKSIMSTTILFGLKGHFSSIFQYFNYRLDLYFINYFMSPSLVGIYTVSVRLGELLWYLPNAVSLVIMPKAAATEEKIMDKLTPKVLMITLCITLMGAIVMVVLGKSAIRIIYSEKFIESYLPLLALLPGILLMGGCKVLSNEIAGRGYPIYNTINTAIAFAITVALDLLLIPRFKVIGASLATTCTYSTMFAMSIIFWNEVKKKGSKQKK